MKTFDEVYKEIKDSASVSKSGKVKKTFSRADFDRLTKAFVNTPDYTTTVCSTQGGKLVKSEVKPVELFRSSMKRVLLDFGVDKQEAAKMDTEYNFTNVTGWYEMMAEDILNYMDANKKFDFPTKEDFKGSITIKNVGESVGEYSSIKRKGDNSPVETFKIKTKPHRVLEKKSKAPNWLKKKFK